MNVIEINNLEHDVIAKVMQPRIKSGAGLWRIMLQSKSRRSCMTPDLVRGKLSPTRICSNILIWRDSYSAR